MFLSTLFVQSTEYSLGEELMLVNPFFDNFLIQPTNVPKTVDKYCPTWLLGRSTPAYWYYEIAQSFNCLKLGRISCN